MDAVRPDPVPSIPKKFPAGSSGGVLAGVLLAGVVLVAGRLPLWHTDFWGHLRFGQVLREAAIQGLNNGLSEAENERLFVTDDVDEVVALLLRGLRQIGSARSR